MSAAFTVFQTMLDAGIHTAKEKYQQLNKNQRDQYYFEKSEFEILATELEEKNENEKARVMRELISNWKPPEGYFAMKKINMSA